MFSELVSLLSTLGYKVYDTDVSTTPTYPYILVWGGDAAPAFEKPLDGKSDGVSDRVGVTIVAGTPAGVRMVHGDVRALLQPGGYPRTVGGFELTIRDHQPTQVDRDVKVTNTDRHPAFCVDIYTAQK